MSNTEEYLLDKGDAFLLPSNAIYRINDKLDDASDLSSVYSNEPESAIGDGEDADELYMDDDEFARRLYKFGLDVNGLPLRDDLIFKTFDKAANFTLQIQEISWWQKFKGIKGKPVEVPHTALWDYFGGTSCLDINCAAGDQINVLCEEYQVREIGNITSDNRKFLRLPMQWSLGRWITNRSFQPNVGLIPTCWLIKKSFYEKNKQLFVQPTWFMGIADISTAYDYLLEDRSSYKAGLFVIFSPIWLNIDARDHRPYIMLVMCCKGNSILEEMTKAYTQEYKTTKGALDDLNARLTLTLFPRVAEDQIQARQHGSKVLSTHALQTPMMLPPTANAIYPLPEAEKRTTAGTDDAKSGDKRNMDGSKVNSEKEDIDPEHTEHASLPFYIKTYTIRRSQIGRYLLFNRQFSTLYDLVYYYTNYHSPIPHKLNYGPTKKVQVIDYSLV